MLVAAADATLLSICIHHCAPAYSLVIPLSPMNVNANINSHLANNPSTGVSIPKGGKEVRRQMKAKGMKLSSLVNFKLEGTVVTICYSV